MTLLFRTERHWRGATEFMRSARAPFAKPRSEKGIVLFLLGDGRQRPVARTEESVGRQAEDLLAHLLPGQFPGLMAAADGAGENCVADDGHVRRVLRPGADDVSRAVFGVARRVAVGDAQAAEVNEIVGAIALIQRRVLRAGMQPHFRELLPDGSQRRDVVLVGVRDEQVAKLKLVLCYEAQNRLRVP